MPLCHYPRSLLEAPLISLLHYKRDARPADGPFPGKSPLRHNQRPSSASMLESRASQSLMPPALRRSMTLVHATSMVIGIIVGASIFIQPSEITRLVPSPLGLMLVWLAAG